jgi:hypothetical protein
MEPVPGPWRARIPVTALALAILASCQSVGDLVEGKDPSEIETASTRQQALSVSPSFEYVTRDWDGADGGGPAFFVYRGPASEVGSSIVTPPAGFRLRT